MCKAPGNSQLLISRGGQVGALMVLAIDTSMERVQEMRPIATDAVQLDATDSEALRAVNITGYNAVFFLPSPRRRLLQAPGLSTSP